MATLSLGVDFGDSRAIDKVVIYYDVVTTKNGHPDPDVGLVVMGSNNGDQWQILKSLSSTGVVDSVTDLNASFRYMRVQFPAFGFDPTWSHSFKEIQMWGVDTETASIVKSKINSAKWIGVSKNNFYYNLCGRKVKLGY